jgi:hypothetical protein
VLAVLEALRRRGRDAVVFDVASLAGSSLNDDGLLLGGAVQRSGTWVGRGWIRRWAPDGWATGVGVGTRGAACAAAWLGLLTAAVRTAPTTWLTGADDLAATENKLVQYAHARRLGISVPRTLIAADVATVRASLGDDVLIKPLGPGHFTDDAGVAHVVFAQPLPHDITDAELKSAPFLLQQRLEAIEHLRVVTVSHRSWCARLGAAGRPVDWRTQDEAHTSFEPATRPQVQAQAEQLAAALKLGYSSQDWIVTQDGPHILDVNPGGQWLFLPAEVHEQVTDAVAAWLSDPQVARSSS